jgi:2-isopropylmalate synthase
VGVPIPPNYPVFGIGAFETGTGVHADAIVKALERDDHDLADRVYSGVPASWFGREQVIRVGFQSGEANVRWWCETHGVTPTDLLVQAILQRAKNAKRLLTDKQLFAIVQRHKD